MQMSFEVFLPMFERFFDTYTCKGHIMGESMEYGCIYWMLGFECLRQPHIRSNSGGYLSTSPPKIVAIFDRYINSICLFNKSMKAMAHL